MDKPKFDKKVVEKKEVAVKWCFPNLDEPIVACTLDEATEKYKKMKKKKA